MSLFIGKTGGVIGFMVTGLLFQQLAQTLDEFGLTDALGDEPTDFDPLDVRLKTCIGAD